MSNELTANIYLLLVTYYLLLLPGAALPVACCLLPIYSVFTQKQFGKPNKSSIEEFVKHLLPLFT
ncbi:MAG: hypothetical protein ACRC2R_06550 [Xenococcaceae cyanobacterium]